MAKGVYSHQFRKMTFPRIAETDHERERELRTDDLFRRRFQPEHHQLRSLLEDLPIDMIRDFPVSDELHLLNLGIIKR